MFSYRHAFHAGNHADVLKHVVLSATLRYLVQKETALSILDIHAGCGLYRLDGDYARTSSESQQGIQQLLASRRAAPDSPVAAAVAGYLDILQAYNPGMADGGSPRIYPGSPAIMQHFLRPQDQMQLFELQPADMRALEGNMANLPLARRTHVWHEDGFNGCLRFLPPPSRRALVLCDPSYELKSDYAQVVRWLDAALTRFATGTYLIWYPIIPRPEAHELPRKLKTLARQAGKSWLHATLSIKSGVQSGVHIPGEKVKRGGMAASGVVVINPPYTLHAELKDALPQLRDWMGQDHLAGFHLEKSPDHG
ncbi:23S rRNA (adenine(2030)-N(6))-methyltransferase RlmJ [Corticibacter populi]|uniref:Ribosomal RNA large subunit methyltransferase J n=1 Tax=Corticibacter populi TaxID=1550736 RepID=A0A3M6R0L8_9BURK|nr:23S rRNA (adenine(2030)-N(6))-methyltransferase RlmJ [Corticibacter populi]RMX08804.1 23S rRNA (adenine(2030)-N(6))-methyltransferase RlmJ [Corticibacter populi]